MSGRLSRRRLLSTLSAATMGSFVGCLNVTENEDIDITVSNASGAPVEYDVSVDSFAETGAIEVDGSDQYEDKLGQPESSSQFEVAASFTLQLDAGQTESQGPTDNQTRDNGTSNGPESDRFETTVDIPSDVTEVSVTYTGGQMIVNPVIESEDS
jgi:hypothetical protein